MKDKPKNLDEMIWACAKGEIPSVEAAKRCGMEYQKFYKQLRRNVEAYALFREKVSRRKTPLVTDFSRRVFKREHDFEYESHLAMVMAQYQAKCKLALKERLARDMGLSYGYYVAFSDGYGRVNFERG